MEYKAKRKRPGWDETFMNMAMVIAERSACVYYRVGVVFTRGKQFLQVGFNGPTKGSEHCCDVGCAKKRNGEMLPPGSKMCRGAHAEMNAIVNACSEGVSLKGATVYCTWSPCYDCAKHLVNLGIEKFIYIAKYSDEYPQVEKLFRESKIYIHQAIMDENGFRLVKEEINNE